MKYSPIKKAILLSGLAVASFASIAAESIIESLMVEPLQSEMCTLQKSVSAPTKRNITMVKGQDRKAILMHLLGDDYRDDALPVVAYGTDINSAYYEMLSGNKGNERFYTFGTYQGQTDANEIVPDDPFFMEWQYNNFEKGTEITSRGAPNSISPFNLTIPFAPSVIGVIDGEFAGNVDTNVVDGMGFYALLTEDQVVGPRIHDDYDNGSKAVCGELDSTWHGLGVTAISSAHMNNSVGMAGYSQSDVVYAKAMQCGFGWSDDIARALYWEAGATKNDVPNEIWIDDVLNWRQIEPVDVINMSLGGDYECPDFYQDALDFATTKNVPVVVAAGNENNDGVSSPAVCDGAIGVVALDGDGNKAEYSNYGKGADIAVVGSAVASYMVPDEYEESDDITGQIPQNMRYMSGTSMAAPIVSAVVAQMRQVDVSISPQEILTILQETADPFPEDSNCFEEYYCGAGILNAERALQVASGREIEDVALAVPSLNTIGECYEEVLTLNAQGLKKVCEAYDVDFSGLRYMARDFENLTFNIYQVEVGGDIQDGAQPVATTKTPFAKMHDLNADEYDYIVRACGGDECEQSMDAFIDVEEHESNICD